MRIGFVACCGQKLNRPSPAGEIYVSPLFKMSRQAITKGTSSWFILSAKHGLLRPDEIISPYDQSLQDMNKEERQQWTERVRSEILKVAGDAELIVLAGELYLRPFEGLPNRIIKPLKGLVIGKRLKFLKELGG